MRAKVRLDHTHSHLGVVFVLGRGHEHGDGVDTPGFQVLLPEVQHGQHGVTHQGQQVLTDHREELHTHKGGYLM